MESSAAAGARPDGARSRRPLLKTLCRNFASGAAPARPTDERRAEAMAKRRT
jgi:hypothetical protein